MTYDLGLTPLQTLSLFYRYTQCSNEVPKIVKIFLKDALSPDERGRKSIIARKSIPFNKKLFCKNEL